ncbi:hypothetical protein UlMin_031754 [Ulmus minor]
MMLRSCSTPVLGSLVSSISESPHHYETKPIHNKLSFPQTGSTNLTRVSCSSSPISPSINGDKGFRRAQSEGNLEGLAYAYCGNNSDDQFGDIFLKRPKCSILQTIPSFSFCNSKFGSEDDESDEEAEEFLERKVATEVGDFGLEGKMKKKGVTEEVGVKNVDDRNEEKNRRMKLLKGLGIGGSRGGGGGGGGGDKGGGVGGGFNWWGGSGGDDGDKQRMEEYFKDLVEAYPGNALFLRNYAEFLYESKGDLGKAEEYYFRAILADPKDGEILLEYAKVVWELHHDKDKAAIYFGKAVQVSPKDCNIQAAYANFLWETEVIEEEDQPGVGIAQDLLPPLLNGGTIY